MTPTMKFSYLEHVQDRLKEMYDILKISKKQYVYMMNLTYEEAKKLIEENPEAFRLNKYKDAKQPKDIY